MNVLLSWLSCQAKEPGRAGLGQLWLRARSCAEELLAPSLMLRTAFQVVRRTCKWLPAQVCCNALCAKHVANPMAMLASQPVAPHAACHWHQPELSSTDSASISWHVPQQLPCNACPCTPKQPSIPHSFASSWAQPAFVLAY